MADFQNLKYTKDGDIGIVTISRPKAMNALNTDLLVELGKVADLAAEDKNLKIIIFTGEGKAFVAGADIAEMRDFNSEQGREWGELGAGVTLVSEQLPKEKRR